MLDAPRSGLDAAHEARTWPTQSNRFLAMTSSPHDLSRVGLAHNICVSAQALARHQRPQLPHGHSIQARLAPEGFQFCGRLVKDARRQCKLVLIVTSEPRLNKPNSGPPPRSITCQRATAPTSTVLNLELSNPRQARKNSSWLHFTVSERECCP